MKFKFSKVIAFRILAFILVILLVAFGGAFYRRTLIDWWTPAIVVVTIAVLTSFLSPKWERLTRMDSRIINYICHLICVGALCYALFLSTNYLFADTASTHTESVMVQKKYVETKKHRSRHRHGGYGRTYETKSHYLQLAFENGWVKSIYVPQPVYNKTIVGKPKVMTLRKGLFGFPIISKGI